MTDEEGFIGISKELSYVDIWPGRKNRFGRELLHLGDDCPVCGQELTGPHRCGGPETCSD